MKSHNQSGSPQMSQHRCNPMEIAVVGAGMMGAIGNENDWRRAQRMFDAAISCTRCSQALVAALHHLEASGDAPNGAEILDRLAAEASRALTEAGRRRADACRAHAGGSPGKRTNSR